MAASDKFSTIESAVTGEFRDRGSKFLAFAWPVQTMQDVKERLHAAKKEHPKAAHHCYAFRLGTDGLQFRASDDGEPAGSAGKPILGQIDSAGITDVLVVVVRYFGGTLLGIPGLINAYKTAPAEALSRARKVEKWIEIRYEISFDYPVAGEVLHLLKQHEATVYSRDMQLFCQVIAGIPRHAAGAAVAKLADIRNVTVKPLSPGML